MLGAGGRLVALAKAAREAAYDEEADTAITRAVDDLREWDEVLRRQFLAGAGAVMAAGLPLGDITRGDSVRIALDSREAMDVHLAIRAAQGRLDNLRGAGAVYQQAIDHHRQVLTWLASAPTDRERRQIAALASNTGGFTGFLLYDLGLKDSGAIAFRDAAEHAWAAGDLSSCVNQLGQLSRIHADQGHYRHAFNVADRALDIAGTKAHPAVRSWLHAVHAHHQARLGDARAAQADLNAAWRLLGRVEDGEKPIYIGYLDAAELGKWTGHVMAQLGTTSQGYLRTGRDALDQARTDWPATSFRGTAELLTASARIHQALGERDIATHFAARAVAIASDTGSARNLRAALSVHNEIAASKG